MSSVCCKEFKGWCRSFTKTEAYLSLLELVLLITFVAVLIFVILHFVACVKVNEVTRDITTQMTPSDRSTASVPVDHHATTRRPISAPTPLPKHITCTLVFSRKTTLVTRYYDDIQNVTKSNKETVAKNDQGSSENKKIESCFIALVKYISAQYVAIGCTLTVVSTQWTITAASCVQDINKTDLLDNFFMMEELGAGSSGKLYPISDVVIHPMFGGSNINCDLAAIRSQDNIMTSEKWVTLPTLVNYMTVTIGEQIKLFSFTTSRIVDKHPVKQGIRHIQVYKLPLQQCSNLHARSTRHLLVGSSDPQVYRKGPICAGVVVSRRAPCDYCAGAPLMYRGVLLGVMADNPNCGLSCDPAIYVNIATMGGWIRSVITSG